MRQLLVESLILAGGGGALGLVVAKVSVELLLRFDPGRIPRIDETVLDWRVLTVAALVSAAAGVAAGLAPTFQGASSSPSEPLKGGAGSVSSAPGARRLKTLIVVVEIAAAVVLLAVSGLFLRSFGKLLGVDPGFDPQGLLVARMRLDGETYGGGGAHP